MHPKTIITSHFDSLVNAIDIYTEKRLEEHHDASQDVDHKRKLLIDDIRAEEARVLEFYQVNRAAFAASITPDAVMAIAFATSFFVVTTFDTNLFLLKFGFYLDAREYFLFTLFLRDVSKLKKIQMVPVETTFYVGYIDQVRVRTLFL